LPYRIAQTANRYQDHDCKLMLGMLATRCPPRGREADTCHVVQNDTAQDVDNNLGHMDAPRVKNPM